jgi:hypothetical protein
MRTRPAAEVSNRSGRCNHVRELLDGPLDQRTLLWLIAPPSPSRAFAVVDEAEKPTRGRNGGDTTARPRGTRR